MTIYEVWHHLVYEDDKLLLQTSDRAIAVFYTNRLNRYKHKSEEFSIKEIKLTNEIPKIRYIFFIKNYDEVNVEIDPYRVFSQEDIWLFCDDGEIIDAYTYEEALEIYQERRAKK